MLNEDGRLEVRDPYKGLTYSQVINLVDHRKLYHEAPHKVRKVPGAGVLVWYAEIGRWVTPTYRTVH